MKVTKKRVFFQTGEDREKGEKMKIKPLNIQSYKFLFLRKKNRNTLLNLLYYKTRTWAVFSPIYMCEAMTLLYGHCSKVASVNI